eukprot:1658532-Rhodomonas_salina.3
MHLLRPVLTECTGLRTCYGMAGTDAAYGGTAGDAHVQQNARRLPPPRCHACCLLSLSLIHISEPTRPRLI